MVLLYYACRALIDWRLVPDPEHMHLRLIDMLHERVWLREANNGGNN